jgi:hypothetical protein
MSPTQAPPLLPPDFGRPTRHQVRLRAVICREIGRIENPRDREMFSNLLDFLTPREGDDWGLPRCRANGRAEYPNKRAILYATIVHAIRSMWAKVSTADLEIAVLQAEAFADLTTLVGYNIVGDIATGYTLEIKPNEPAPLPKSTLPSDQARTLDVAGPDPAPRSLPPRRPRV